MYLWLTVLIVGIPAYYFLRQVLQLFLNYLTARKTGLKYLVAPVNTVSPPWIILSPLFLKPLERYLPAWLWEPINHCIYGWEFRNGFAPHARNGEIFLLVTAGPIEVMIADPDVANDILRRPKEFRMSDVGAMIMGKFGDNLLIAQYKSWERMRRFIAPLINDRISSTVFQESKTQAETMTKHLGELKTSSTNSAEGLKQIAMNVLGAAGYGKPRTWTADKFDVEQPPQGFHVTYLQAVRYLTENLVEMAFIPSRILSLGFMGYRLNTTAHAVHELPALTRKLLDEERNAPSNVTGRANIAKLLVQEQSAAEKGTITLHDDEIVGNLFVFSIAGTDTTANTMAYALFMLAAYPEWQDWIIEEIDEVLAGKGEELEYNDIHPKLIRTLALMHETLRIFVPLTHIARGISEPTDITYQGRTVTLPANCIIYINSYALHLNPKIWSPSATDPSPDVFDPSRFVTTSTPTHPDDSENTSDTKPEDAKTIPVGKATIKTPKNKGAFVPWSTGPRVCPGQKMSQVEFVTVFMTIFRSFRVEVAHEEGDGKEGTEEARETARGRVKAAVRDSFPRLTMQMNSPEKVGLRFVKR